MLKKSLIALAIAGLTTAANAGTLSIAGGDVKVSVEGNVKLGSKVLESDVDFGSTPATDDVTLDVGSDYIVNDIVVFTISGAEFDTSVTAIEANPSAGGATFSLVDYPNKTSVRFRVSTANHLKANDITLEKFKLKTTPVAKGKIKISSNAISVNPLIGSYDAAKEITLAEFITQASYSVGKLDGTVSTGKGRAEFTDAGSTLKDILTLDVTNTAAVDAVTYDKAVHVIKGDFSYMSDYDANKDGKITGAEVTAAITLGGFASATAVVADSLDKVTVTDAGALTDGTVQFNVKGQTAKGSVIKAPQSFTVDTTLSDTAPTAVSTVLAQTSGGAWKLDGATAETSFLPFGSDYAQSITVTNTGTVVGAITVDLVSGGKSYSKTLTAVAAAKSVTNISLEVAQFAAASGITDNAQVTVTVNAPKANITVEGLYFHKPTAYRVLVPTVEK